MAEVFVSEAATEAVAAGAVVAVEMDKGLGVGCVFRTDACFSPVTYDEVVFGWYLFKDGYAFFSKRLVCFVSSITEKYGCDGIDY